ncbi:hypothetical protein Synpcc7942_1363 [Synechococcus elongatus PCC 7942 = FACHB-805]|uniref:Uncharacterized protein n=2 Tax=Synechococcus elongatus TaxID=32046 RepID=Q31NH6_SYNE7|nr:hypothetical protein Synpcc7942_1363 [Synechococcus elongatus PCC 7942 = FACHB-805]
MKILRFRILYANQDQLSNLKQWQDHARSPMKNKPVHQGDCVRLQDSAAHLYQVISVQEEGGICWVRQWPLRPKSNPVFPVTLSHICHVEACLLPG